MEMYIEFFIVPVIMIISGVIMLYKAPRKMNRFMGYRTSMSMKSPETWKFAHALCGKLWAVIGCILLPLSAIPMVFVSGKQPAEIEKIGGILTAAQVAVMLCSVVYVEYSLRRNFDKNGERKNDWER